jgi:hypothetical protein
VVATGQAEAAVLLLDDDEDDEDEDDEEGDDEDVELLESDDDVEDAGVAVDSLDLLPESFDSDVVEESPDLPAPARLSVR